MNTILLHPTDVLFFRDGRPMEGSLSGHGAAWPLPNVTDAALHAALHRSGLKQEAHVHRRSREDGSLDGNRAATGRHFGSLVTAGPFPVRATEKGRPLTTPKWFFPRPLDLQDSSLTPSLLPTDHFDSVVGSLPDPLEYAVANRLAPNKESKAKPWISAAALESYLKGEQHILNPEESVDDSNFCDREHSIGIAIDPETGAAGQGEAAGKIYSAQYLRVRDDWRLGVFAATAEKLAPGAGPVDLIPRLINSERTILIGGQQRACTAQFIPGPIPVPLPRGLQNGFGVPHGKYLVKWVLLSPAIWPEIPDQSKDGRPMTPHQGGWLPNWVDQESGAVLLRHRSGKIRRDYSDQKCKRVAENESSIAAKLVAALVPKPIPVTGWALAHEAGERAGGGAKSLHLAVPAGAVYYFQAESATDAEHLAAALNWHGSDPRSTTIKNRRSTLLGEKGFGLGVCGKWQFLPDVAGHPKN